MGQGKAVPRWGRCKLEAVWLLGRCFERVQYSQVAWCGLLIERLVGLHVCWGRDRHRR